MMYYSDYGKRIPTGPGLPSSMQRLLGMMQRANQVNAPFLGNLAELYLDTMAGNNKPILGIKLDVHTMNMLLSIGFLRDLLGGGKLVADDCTVLQDFADTGTLDAFIPIAKAFSDRGETHLLVNIMLALNEHYAEAMAPNEPATVKLLESGAVERLFDAINQMTLIVVPSNGEKLIDVLADTVGALVDDSTPIVDRKGRSQRTLVNLLKAPLDDLSAAATSAGVKDQLDGALSNVFNTLLATYKDSAGNDRLVYGALVSNLGDVLQALSGKIPADAAARGAWCDQEEQSISDLLQSRDVAAIVDIFLAIQSSPDAQVFTNALANLFTPVQDSDHDALGAIIQLVAGLIQAPPSGATSSTDAQNMATVMNWVGAEIDPQAGKLTNMMTMMQKVMKIDDSSLFLRILRNLVDMGASGNDDSPLTVLMRVASDVRAADTSGAGSPPDVTALLEKVVAFMDDQQSGLPYMFSIIKTRQKS
ncbi:hypothetical protein HY251_11310 [bacterium]|nr:hypothetical protein [bacterium]